MTNAILQLLCTRRHWGTVESRRPSFIWTTEVCATENHITNSRNSLDLINFDVGLISSEIIVARAWWPNKRQCSNFVDKWYYYTYTIVTFQFPERTVSTSNWSCLSISPFLFFLLVFFFLIVSIFNWITIDSRKSSWDGKFEIWNVRFLRTTICIVNRSNPLHDLRLKDTKTLELKKR